MHEGDHGRIHPRRPFKMESSVTSEQEITGCVFCTVARQKIIAENDLAFAIRDTSLVTHLHSLVLLKRHVASFFDLSEAEAQAIERLLSRLRDEIIARDASVEGFNIGVNIGEVAGQTIFHCHYHLIARRRGDVPNPKGGVRWAIPSKGPY
ncbi:MAG: HIT family protein [Beijerinckiaceae bacterium]